MKVRVCYNILWIDKIELYGASTQVVHNHFVQFTVGKRQQLWLCKVVFECPPRTKCRSSSGPFVDSGSRQCLSHKKHFTCRITLYIKYRNEEQIVFNTSLFKWPISYLVFQYWIIWMTESLVCTSFNKPSYVLICELKI